MNKIKDKNIIITGATSGIGKCVALKLLNAGANVAFCGRSKDKMDKLLSEIINVKTNYYYETFDISNEKSIISFVESAAKNIGSIDILINCAGVNSSRAPVSEIKTTDLEWMLKVNLIAPFIFMREVYKNLKFLNGGLFINILSTVCNFSNEGIGAYTASKAGFDALVKVFRKEFRNEKIRVCSVYPGGVNTAFRDTERKDYLNSEEVADAIISIMHFDDNTSIDELVIRPIIEKNYS